MGELNNNIKVDALLDNTYKTVDDRAVIYLYLINSILKDRDFKPYFYVELNKDKVKEEDIETIKDFLLKNDLLKFVEGFKIVKKTVFRKEKDVIKIIATHPQKVPKLRKVKECPIVKEIYEHDIPFAKRYLIDNEIIPMTYWDFENKKPISRDIPKLKAVAFDMEVYNRGGEPNPEKDPILMASFWDENGGKVITYKPFNHPNVELVENEKMLIKKIVETLKQYDIIYTYNGDNFDFPYLKARAKYFGIDVDLGREGEEIKIKRGGIRYRSYIPGRVHIDLYPISTRLLKLTKYTLEDVVYNLFGIEKLKIPHKKIVDYWIDNKDELIEYSLQDAKYTYKVGSYFFPLEVMFSRIVNQTPFEITRMSSGQMVEYLLMKNAFKENMIVPNKPDDSEYKKRLLETYEGGYVKEPEKGMFEDIVSMDFRCHPKGTKVIVKDKGIVNIENVKEGDYILGIDGWQRVKHVWMYDYEGELININGLKCTPNHKIPLKFGDEIKDIPAKSINDIKENFEDGKVIILKDFDDFKYNTEDKINNKNIKERIGKNIEFRDIKNIFVSLEQYKGKVYDITLERKPYYFANGILTHNSLYPSIIISYNISPETLDCECCKDVSEKILGHWFCKKREGLIPKTLRNLIERRIKIKKKMKELPKDSDEYKLLNYEQQSLKILANSILPDEYLIVIENDGVKVVKIGEYIDKLMDKHSERIKKTKFSEILEINNLKTYAFNRLSKNCSIKKVRALIRHKYSGKAYKVKLRSGRTIRITADHSLFKLEKNKKRYKIVCVRGDELKKGDLIVVPKKLKFANKEVVINIPKRLLNADEEEISNLTISKYKNKDFLVRLKKTLEDIENNKLKIVFNDCIDYLRGLKLIGYNIIPQINKIEVKILNKRIFKNYKRYIETIIEQGSFRKHWCNIQYTKVKDFIKDIPDKEFEDCEIGAYSGKIKALLKLDENLAKFLGFFVLRGRVKKIIKKDETSYEVSIYKSDEKSKEELLDIFIKNFGAGAKDKDRVFINNKIVYLVLKYVFKCGDKNKKHIPEDIFLADENVLKSFLDGFLKAKKHGSGNKGNSFMAKDYAYLQQLMLLFGLFGIPTRFTPIKGRGYKLTINPKYPTIKDLMLDEVNEIEEFEYDGYVYDLSVESYENFLVNNIYVHNSHYGYLAFPRARFYSRECAEVVTYLGRKYIQQTIEEAEKWGFKVIYADTDGFYAIYKEKISKEELIKKAMEFVEYINSKLPETMELEFEGYFKRGIFITKKKYALIDEEGRVTVKGLESVRRDWSNIAKITQKKVLEALLIDGSIEKAKKVIQDIIRDLREKKIKKDDLIIYTQLTKDPKEYKTTAPHIEVAKRLLRQGKRVRVGDIIGYVIVKGTKSISERAKLPEEVDIEDIDVNYYIDNQILPPVLRIMEAVGVSKNELKKEGSQLTLDKFLNI